MVARNFMDLPPPSVESHIWWWYRPVSDLKLETPKMLSSNSTLRAAIDTMEKFGFDQLPVLDESGENLCGVVTTKTILTAMLTEGRFGSDGSVLAALYAKYIVVPPNAPLGKLAIILETEPFVLVVEGNASYNEYIVKFLLVQIYIKLVLFKRD